MAEIVQEVSPLGASAPANGTSSRNSVASRPVIAQTFTPGGGRSMATAEGGGPTIEQTVSSNGAAGPMLKSTTREMLDNLDKYGTVRAPVKPEGETATPAGDAKPAAAPAVAATAAEPVKAPEPAKPAETPVAAPDEHRAAYERVSTRNRELVAEIEKLKGAPTRREQSAREKALDEAERMYLDDPIGSIRRIIATVQGIDDPKHKDVDAELSGLYQDLTARELGVPVDPTRQELRESTRTRLALARDKREWKSEREAATAAPPDDPEAKLAAEHTSLIGTRLTSKSADGKAVGDAYPLTMKLAERLSGKKPEAMILAALRDGFKTGEFDPKEHDHALIEQAAKKIEAQYQALADLIGGARTPATSTATPTPSTDATANKDEAQKQAGRSITNASASVAPATSPAKQSPPAEDKPKYKNENERRLAIARKYIRD